MIEFSSNFSFENQQHFKNPIYVFEILFANGTRGTENLNDVYFGSDDISNIENFPYPDRYFPVLDSDSVSGITQSVDPVNGVSTIGSLSVTLLNKSNYVSDIFQNADEIGQGLRQQLCEVYVLYSGMDWADKVKIRTLHVKNIKLDKNGIDYKLTAEDSQARLKKVVFNPKLSALAGAISSTGAVSVVLTTSQDFKLVAQPVWGTVCFFKINDEIMYCTANNTSTNTLTVPALGRGLFGTVAATHDLADEVTEIILLEENPITMALKVMTSTGLGTNGVWDVLPKHWGAGFEDLNLESWLTQGEVIAGTDSTDPTAGWQFRFIFDSGEDCKAFIEADICKTMGAFSVVQGDGKLRLQAYSDLSNAVKENAVAVLDINNVVKWSDIDYDLPSIVNAVFVRYDEQPALSGNYVRGIVFVNAKSEDKNRPAKQKKYALRGVIATSTYADLVYQRFQRVMARYSTQPIKMTLTLLPSMNGLEIGDIVRVTLPIRDYLTGNDMDRAFEVLKTSWKPKTSQVEVTLLAQPEKAGQWFNGVGEVESAVASPSNVTIPATTTKQMVVRAFDANGNQVEPTTVRWSSSDTAIATVTDAGVVTGVSSGEAVIKSVIGGIASNDCNVTVDTTTGVTISRIQVLPSICSITNTDTFQYSAQAFDIHGVEVTGATFIYTSDTPATAIINSSTGLATAVADGTTNIKATVGAIVSANSPMTVEPLPTSQFSPPSIDDAVYKVGTQITTHGPVGGPHVIPDGYDFTSGDYWYDGDVSLDFASSITINGSVRIFSLGNITINGTIDGETRGGLNGGVAPFGGGSYWYGNVGQGTGYSGRGGTGGRSASIYGITGYGGAGGAVNFSTQPSISVSASTVDGSGVWTAVTGIPSAPLVGSGGGSGASWGGAGQEPSLLSQGGTGGVSGAGLLLMGRGVFLTSGQIRLGGGNATNPLSGGFAGGGGGGGGGSFIALAERDAKGLPVLSVDPSRVLTGGGLGGVAGTSGSGASPGFVGGTGAKILQVIG